jgi:parvulin-like peptidyl-prolyl isomerase
LILSVANKLLMIISLKNFIILISVLVSSISAAQTKATKIIEELTNITNQEQAFDYLKKKNLLGDIYRCTSLDSTRIDVDLLSANLSNVIEYRNTGGETTHIFKVLETDSAFAYKVNYIYFDNSKINLKRIDSLRDLITNKLKQGISFESLAQKYSMDGNGKNGGALDWFTEDVMMAPFVDAIKTHETGAVFKVNIPEKKWYYVVLNSHKPLKIVKVTALFVEINN